MTGEYESPFGGLDSFPCGDLKQLSPVDATPVYYATRDSLWGRAILWHALDFRLSKAMRQRYIGYFSVLAKIGRVTQLNAQGTKLIHDRFRTRQWCNELAGESTLNDYQVLIGNIQKRTRTTRCGQLAADNSMPRQLDAENWMPR